MKHIILYNISIIIAVLALLFAMALLVFPSLIMAQDISKQQDISDTFIRSSKDSSNYGAATFLRVGTDTTGGIDTSRVLLYSPIFNLIPAGATVDSFKITLYKYKNTATLDTAFDSGALILYGLDSSFTEGNLTGDSLAVNWNYRDSALVGLWATPGGDYNATMLDSQAFSMTTDSVVFFDDSLAAWAQDYVDGDKVFRGFEITAYNEADSTAKYYMVSSDSSVSTSRPKFDLWYTIPARAWYDIFVRDSSGVRYWMKDTSLTDFLNLTDTSAVKGLISDSTDATSDIPGLNDSLAVLMKRAAVRDSAEVYIMPDGISNDSLVAYYPLDANALDYSGNSNDGVNFGADNVTQLDSFIIGTGAYSFNGITDYMTANGVISYLANTNEGTIKFNFKMRDATPAAISKLLSFGDTNAAESINIQVQTNGTIFASVQDAGTNQWAIATTGSISDNTWYELCLRMPAGGDAEIYLNGVKPAQTFSVTTDKLAWFDQCTGIDNFNIGRYNLNSATGQYARVIIDNLRIDKRALSASEVYDSYIHSAHYAQENTFADKEDVYTAIMDSLTAYALNDTLPIAQVAVLGGVKVGSGLAVTADGTLSTSGTGSVGNADSLGAVPAADYALKRPDTLNVFFTGSSAPWGFGTIGDSMRVADTTYVYSDSMLQSIRITNESGTASTKREISMYLSMYMPVRPDTILSVDYYYRMNTADAAECSLSTTLMRNISDTLFTSASATPKNSTIPQELSCNTTGSGWVAGDMLILKIVACIDNAHYADIVRVRIRIVHHAY